MQIQISWLLQKPTDLDLHCLLRQGMSCSAREELKCCLLKFLPSMLSLKHVSSGRVAAQVLPSAAAVVTMKLRKVSNSYHLLPVSTLHIQLILIISNSSGPEFFGWDKRSLWWMEWNCKDHTVSSSNIAIYFELSVFEITRVRQLYSSK